MARVGAMNYEAADSAQKITFAAQNNYISKAQNSGQFEKILDSTNGVQGSVSEQSSDRMVKKDFSADQSNKLSEQKDFIADTTKNVEANNQNTKSTSLSPEEKAAIVEVASEMKAIIRKEFNLDDQTLEDAMTSMGIILTDLLDPNILQQFILQVNHVKDSTAFLTDEILLGTWNQTMQLLADLQNEHPDAFMALMKVLETPMTLEEFLSETDVSSDLLTTEKPVTDSFESIMTEVSETLGDDIDVSVQQGISVADSLSQDSNIQMLASRQGAEAEQNVGLMAEKVLSSEEIPNDMKLVITKGETQQNSQVISDSTEEVVVNAMDDVAEDGDSSESGENNNSNAFQNNSSQSEGLFAQRGDAPVVNDNMATLFTEQFSGVQGNVNQVFSANISEVFNMQRMVDIVNQVSEQIHQVVDEATTTMEMQLNPESLGKVLLTVSSKEGVMTATFRVQSEEAKQALESQMATLRENLESKNLKVESVDVQISHYSGFNQSNEADRQMQEEFAKQGKKKFRFDDALEEDVVEESAEQTRQRVMRDYGSSVNYTV